MENSVAAAAAEVVEKAFADTPFELVDVEFKKERSGWNIIVYADTATGLTLDDCETITHLIDPLLDEDERINGKHDHLIVSSPGLDRPLRSDKDFRRVLGKRLDIKLFAPYLGKRDHVAMLDDFDDTSLFMTLDNGRAVTFPRAEIASAKQYIDFN